MINRHIYFEKEMTRPTNFYRLIELEKACPRKMVFYILNIQGIPQYYFNKVIFERGKVFEFLLKKFGLEGTTDLDRIHDNFKNRFKNENENVDNILENLDSLISKNKIKITEANKKIDYALMEKPIRLYVDAVGTFNGQNALFKMNMGQIFRKIDALELVCAESLTYSEKKTKFKLISMKLGKGDYREIFELGDRNKNGSLSKKGLPPWEEIKIQADEKLKTNYELIEKMEKNPDEYNINVFGTCGTCPYHNFEVKYNGQKIICTG